MPDFHLAQINVARFRLDPDDPHNESFIDQLAAVNALADDSPGFVWRLQGEEQNAMAFRVFEDPNMLINMSVWDSTEALFDYTYKTAHTKIMAQRKEWFDRVEDAYMALWWVPAGHIPDPQEGKDRLELLRENGPGPDAHHEFDRRTNTDPRYRPGVCPRPLDAQRRHLGPGGAYATRNLSGDGGAGFTGDAGTGRMGR